MGDDLIYYVVEQFVDLGNESFWHEKARLLMRNHSKHEEMADRAHLVARRDVVKYGGRYRIRVESHVTEYDSGAQV